MAQVQSSQAAEAKLRAPQSHTNIPKVLKFLNDYRKELSKLKIKSFYANHLCKKNCVEGKFGANNQACINECDSWLKMYFEFKAKQNPDAENQLIYANQTADGNRDQDYLRSVRTKKVQIKEYLGKLEGFLDAKIKIETKV